MEKNWNAMEKLWKSYGISFLGICTNPEELRKWMLVKLDIDMKLEFTEIEVPNVWALFAFKIKNQ